MDTNHPYGMTWHDSLVTFDHDSSSWRMSQQSLAFTEGPSTAEWLETWPKWGIMQNGIVWELPMSERCTGDGDGSSSVGYQWPTPTARNAPASTIPEDGANTMRSRPQRQRARGSAFHQEAQSNRQASESLTVDGGQWAVEPSMGRVVDGVSTRVARSHNRAALKALGNAVVPQCAYVVGRSLNQIIEEGR